MAATNVGVSRASFFDFNIKCLVIVGLWPNENWAWYLKVLYKGYQITLLVFAFIYLTFTGTAIYLVQDDLIRLLEDLDKLIVSYNYITKVIMFIIKRHQIRDLITEILHSGDVVDKEREKLMKYHIFLVASTTTTIIGSFMLLAQANGELVVDAWMPFDHTRNQWTLFMATQILGVLFGIPFMYRAIAIQGIVCSIIMYICDQLIELQKRLKVLAFSETNEVPTRNEFKSIIRKHIRLMGYSKSLRSVFKEYFLIQNLAITSELCLNALMVSIVGMQQKKYLITFLAYLIIAILNAYIFCYLSQELMDQSAEIAYSAYESAWTSWPLDMQKDLLIVITVAQKNFTLSAGGMANMSMETFAQALYNGYSIFAVLSDVVD